MFSKKRFLIFLALCITSIFLFPCNTKAKSYKDYSKSFTKKEKSIAKKHPVQSYKAYQCAEKATKYTVKYYKKNGWKDNSDAFRHCLWNALMKKEIGKNAAKEWANAHEPVTNTIDAMMDLHNNSIGRSLKVTSKTKEKTIISLVKSAVKKGKCKRIKVYKLKTGRVSEVLIPTNGDGLK